MNLLSLYVSLTAPLIESTAVIKGAKEKMRELIGDPKALAPQIFNDDQYCGVSLPYSVLDGTGADMSSQPFDTFMAAVEDGNLYEFLKLPPPPEAQPPADPPAQ